jgi:hypothetical protein
MQTKTVTMQHPLAEGILRRQRIAVWCKKFGIAYYNKTEGYTVVHTQPVAANNKANYTHKQ